MKEEDRRRRGKQDWLVWGAVRDKCGGVWRVGGLMRLNQMLWGEGEDSALCGE